MSNLDYLTNLAFALYDEGGYNIDNLISIMVSEPNLQEDYYKQRYNEIRDVIQNRVINNINTKI